MFTLMDLPYSYEALATVIDSLTVETHYSKHHAGYVKKLNAALENNPELAQMDLVELLKNLDKVPAEIKTAVFNNGNQVFNHNIYWESLTPNSGGIPEGQLANKINQSFGSFEDFKAKLSSLAAGQFGSGWAWLSLAVSGDLEISSTSNADNPLMQNKKPLLTIDVWEHAYYLKYKNLRPDYINNIWQIINWKEVEKKFEAGA